MPVPSVSTPLIDDSEITDSELPAFLENSEILVNCDAIVLVVHVGTIRSPGNRICWLFISNALQT